jgi:hypothetical protein
MRPFKGFSFGASVCHPAVAATQVPDPGKGWGSQRALTSVAATMHQ